MAQVQQPEEVRTILEDVYLMGEAYVKKEVLYWIAFLVWKPIARSVVFLSDVDHAEWERGYLLRRTQQEKFIQVEGCANGWMAVVYTHFPGVFSTPSDRN